ncbi:ADP-ribosylation factor GTPase-activating protein 1 [Manis javanica]|nr:ADP-ribosylation factor GTPase-activating protein 1 [Manis javanica]
MNSINTLPAKPAELTDQEAIRQPSAFGQWFADLFAEAVSQGGSRVSLLSSCGWSDIEDASPHSPDLQ